MSSPFPRIESGGAYIVDGTPGTPQPIERWVRAPDLLATATAPAPLLQDKVQPFNCASGSITAATLPALSGLPLWARFGAAKTDPSGNTLTIPFFSGDTSLDGSTQAQLSMPGTAELQVMSNPAGGKLWRVVNHVRSDAAMNAAYVTVLGTSNGTDDTAWINAALAAGGRFRGRSGQTYLISAPLVVPSNTDLDMGSSTVSLIAGSNCNMLNNAAVTPVATAADGACTSGSAIITSATLAAVAVAGQTIVTANANGTGVPWVGNVVSVAGSNITLATTAGATIVSAATVTLYRRDVNITIQGGTWDRGANAGTGVGLHGLRLRHVDGLTIRDLTVKSTGGKYMIAPGDVTNLRVANITAGGVQSAIVQANGPLVNFVIRDIFGTSGDDSVALTPSDYTTYNDTAGDITDGIIDGINTTSGARLCNVLGGAPTTALKRVVVRNLLGSVTGNQPALVVGDDHANVTTTGGLVQAITVQNVQARVADATAPLILLNGNNTDSVTINGFRFNNSACTSSGVILLSPSATATYRRLIITDGDVPACGTAPIICVGSSSTVTSLVAERLHGEGATAWQFLKTFGVITDLVLRSLTGGNSTEYAVRLDQNTAAAAITRGSFSDIHLNTTAGMITAIHASHTVGKLTYSNVEMNAAVWPLGDFNCTAEIHLANFTSTSPSQGIANVRAAAVLTVYGSGGAIAVGSNGLKVTAGGKVSNRAWDMPPSTTAGGFPTIAAGAGAGTSPTVTVAGSDRAGTVTVTPGTSPAAGIQATVTFIGTWPQTPKVSLTPTNAAAQAAGAYVSSKSTTTFVISTANSPGGSMTFDYVIAA